jgi:hypothetical protein
LQKEIKFDFQKDGVFLGQLIEEFCKALKQNSAPGFQPIVCSIVTVIGTAIRLFNVIQLFAATTLAEINFSV